MTAMPQLVALFNGVEGGAAALIAVVEYLVVDSDDLLFLIFTVATVIVGSIAFSGSIVTYLKLQELMTTWPVVIPLGKWITILVAVATVVGGVWLIVQPQECCCGRCSGCRSSSACCSCCRWAERTCRS